MASDPSLSIPPAPPLTSRWDAFDWQPSLAQQQQFQTLYDLVLQGNQRMNLTRVTGPEAFWEKHLWDSLRGLWPGLAALPQPANSQQAESLQVIDIGSGAGFPGLPAAIAFPHWQVTLLDSTQKKVAFIAETIEALGLPNAAALAARAEAVGQAPEHRQRYDLALIRAVAPAVVCAEYALPLLRLGGSAILYRGQWSTTETEQLIPVLHQLGGKIQQVDPFTTPLSQGDRHSIVVAKVAPTPPTFPRAVGVPAKHPLAAP
ncbi:MAG: 16S rRNA (guanine(527)-N(7))-methyltransferase RsmG [Cyanobacteria bacterium P01_A01_bin.135]